MVHDSEVGVGKVGERPQASPVPALEVLCKAATAITTHQRPTASPSECCNRGLRQTEPLVSLNSAPCLPLRLSQPTARRSELPQRPGTGYIRSAPPPPLPSPPPPLSYKPYQSIHSPQPAVECCRKGQGHVDGGGVLGAHDLHHCAQGDEVVHHEPHDGRDTPGKEQRRSAEGTHVWGERTKRSVLRAQWPPQGKCRGFKASKCCTTATQALLEAMP